jgi:hypothetical protein
VKVRSNARQPTTEVIKYTFTLERRKSHGAT